MRTVLRLHFFYALSALLLVACASPLSTPTPALGTIAAPSNGPYFDPIWKTDFSKHSVPLEEVKFFGLGHQDVWSVAERGVYFSLEEASESINDLQPVIAVEVNGEARAYPQSMLIFVYSEVVNDVLGGVPITVTW